jgi:formylglycine-generating enzyme
MCQAKQISFKQSTEEAGIWFTDGNFFYLHGRDNFMKKVFYWFLPGLITGSLIMLGAGKLVRVTSENSFCESCHIHPQATTSWKRSVHYDTRSGTRTNCVDCHLPPKGEGYLAAKAVTGARDVWGKWTKDPESFDWEAKSQPEYARKHVYESSCLGCHENLFPAKLTKEGEEAHLYYTNYSKSKDIQCINCHLNAGHYIEGYTHGSNKSFGVATASKENEVWESPADVEGFGEYEEKIPGTTVSFAMAAIPGGTFMMGSPESEPFRRSDEGPVREVEVDSFYMAVVEVTWDEYLAFYAMTSAEGRSTDTEGSRLLSSEVDAISGATPPYGQPDQGWGLGSRPAITITYHAAETYCMWLSQVTGKSYRLPTEAEWEYAARGGTTGPYFFDGDPLKYERQGLRGRLAGNDTTVINSYVIYAANSRSRTAESSVVRANPFGLKNMLGNVAEFCSDWYSEDAYSAYPDGIIRNPAGPDDGTEKVIRGGSFRDGADRVRVAARAATQTEAWQRTDPQMPKSRWWYSDCNFVGFRVVCEYDAGTGREH